MNGIGIIRKLNEALPRHSLITIYKSFVRLHLDYGDKFITNQISKISIKTLKEFNTMLLVQLQMPSKKLLSAGYANN